MSSVVAGGLLDGSFVGIVALTLISVLGLLGDSRD